MKKWMFLLLLLPIACFAQTYKYIGVEDGLSNRRVYSIQKDNRGYMWFLTHEGIDRYNGKEFKFYKLMDEGKELNSMLNLNWLHIDQHGVLWEVGKKGKIFKYDEQHDAFTLAYKLTEPANNENVAPISYSFLGRKGYIWLCAEKSIYFYNTQTQAITTVKNNFNESISCIEQIDDTHYYIGTETGIHYAELAGGTLRLIACKKLDEMFLQINALHYDSATQRLFIGTFQRGIFVYDLKTELCTQLQVGLTDASISCIRPFSAKELLIATDGAGVYQLNTHTLHTSPYIIADYNSSNAMNGNSINDIYIDHEQRIWLANYPFGVTVRNNRYASYQWLKHSIGYQQSLINDQVNAVFEDSEGDLWYATNNGVSLYDTKNKHWHSFLSSFDHTQKDKNNVFLTLCEGAPGIIWLGGYGSGIHLINKNTLSITSFNPSVFHHLEIRPDKYIRSIIRDSEGNIWSGGYYNLKVINPRSEEIRLYPSVNTITAIVERNKQEMWIGCADGLYLLNRASGNIRQIKMPVESTYIYSMIQTPDGMLYIGTGGSGLLVYDAKKNHFKQHYIENSSLTSNNIYTVLYDGKSSILLSTEYGLTRFFFKENLFQNWTKDQGLMTTRFNASSGTLRKNGQIVFGSSDGAVEFSRDMKLPRTYSSKMVFSDFSLFYQTVYPGDKGSPLTTDIDSIQVLDLKYNQNIFSLKVSSINYDYPSNILYSWKLEGFYNEWSHPGNESTIRFTNLSPGEYTLHIRAVSSEDKRVVLEERTMEINVAYPFWLSLWAVLIYALFIALLGSITLRFIMLRKQRKISDEKIHFFINTAHDIRTPLTLIKAPLEELREKEQLSIDGVSNMNIALRNVNALLRLTTNLINFERADMYSSELFIAEFELNTYMTEIFNVFRPYAEVKQINFTYETNFRYMNVWFDKEKMESILKNIITNALKYTPEGGNIHIFVNEGSDSWSMEVKDTGIGIPASEQNKLFKIHFRGSNAINSKITGSGIGLMLVWKLVHLHGGKITMNSIEHQGSVVKVTFPKECKEFRRAHLATNSKAKVALNMESTVNASPEIYETAKRESEKDQQRLLIVEDNDELRNYLHHTLAEQYTLQVCSNGKEALTIVKEYKPELIISDIMMPEMRGDELCSILKNDIETSHIPIILLTALNDDKNILAGLRIGADEYVVKPFNIGILKATIANLLANRALLRNKYANPDEVSDGTECINCSSDLDWKFIATVKKSVEENMDNSAFTVDVLCSLLNMSRTSLYNKIKALTDQAPGDYVRIIRLTRAAKLLKEGKHNITEIAELTGFNDAKYFREVFKKHYKVSPSKYGKGDTAASE